ncbi:c-type cytochrome [Devosia rhizoryzae]|uniref:Cytochrome c n=1 Tax=Devosia rhizoryzae TaxID=2774137 RepID=A0ABX7C495_9HYPH|nr:cytochrome c [Devosia rhizoryzae]QQR38064.1 cytochrome c [Devosia rhizoryzae]
MPAFGKRLSEAEIEAVGTFIRNSWGNSFGPFPAP